VIQDGRRYGRFLPSPSHYVMVKPATPAATKMRRPFVCPRENLAEVARVVGDLRGKVRFTWRRRTAGGYGIVSANASGRGATSSRRWATTVPHHKWLRNNLLSVPAICLPLFYSVSLEAGASLRRNGV